MVYGQDIETYQFGKEFGGIPFDTIEVMAYEQTADGLDVYLLTKRAGAIRYKIGPLMDGGQEWTTIMGVSKISFDQELTRTGEEFFLVKPEDAIGKIDYFSAPKGMNDFLNGGSEKIGTQDDAMSLDDLEARYPALQAPATEEGRPEAPSVYYRNRLASGLFNGKIKGFVTRTFTVKEGKKADVGLIGSAFNTLGARYDTENEKIDWDDYRSPAKKDFWATLTVLPPTDNFTGRVYSVNGLKSKDKAKRGNEKREVEFVTYGPNGEVVSREDVKFSKDMSIERQWVDKERVLGNLDAVYGTAYLFREQKEKRAQGNDRVLYRLDKDGKVLYNADFSIDNNSVAIRFLDEVNGRTTIIGSGDNPGQFINYVVGEDGVMKQDISDGKIFQNFGLSIKEYQNKFLLPRYQQTYANGNTLVVAEVTGKESATNSQGQQYSVNSHKGTLMLVFDAEGKIVKNKYLGRKSEDADRYAAGFEVLSDTEDESLVLIYEPVITELETGHTRFLYFARLYRLDKEDLKMRPLYLEDSTIAGSESVFFDEKSNRLYVLTENPVSGKLTMSQVTFE